MRIFLTLLLTTHGLIHLMGFVKAFKLAEVQQLTHTISKPAGVFWLLAALLFIVAAALVALKGASWWIPAVPALVLSQILIFLFWSDAKFGSIANALVLLPLFIAVMGSFPSSFSNVFKREVQKGLQRSTTPPIVREEDLAHLPKQVQKYLHVAGTVGKPGVQNVHVRCKGQIRTKVDGDWMDFTSDQYNFLDDPSRLYFIESSLYGIPFQGLHMYIGPNAIMQIKFASMFLVVDAKGPEMNKSETVTLFNDMCVLMPAVLIDRSIQWEEVDSLTVRAKFTNAGNAITATLSFNEHGELINFSSDDRYQSSDGKTYKQYRWTTPMKNYRDFGGMNLASHGEATWHTPEGELVYAKMTIELVEYNCGEFH